MGLVVRPNIQFHTEIHQPGGGDVGVDVDPNERLFAAFKGEPLEFYKFCRVRPSTGSLPLLPRAGIHPTAVVGENVEIHEDVFIGANTVIENDCVVGRGSVIETNVTCWFKNRQEWTKTLSRCHLVFPVARNWSMSHLNTVLRI